MGRNMGDPFFANRETLPLLRKQELIDACKAMDITDLRMLGLRDKTLEFEDDEWLADMMEEIIDDVKPSLIVTFYPEHGVHPDHDACGEAVIRALYRKKKRTARARFAWQSPATGRKPSASLMSFLILKRLPILK